MAERYFSKSKGRVLLVFLFSLLIIAMLFLTSPVYASGLSEDLPQTSTVCTWNGNTYYPGQYFYNNAGQQFLCYSDGTYHFTGVTMVPRTYTMTYPTYTCSTSCNSYTCYTTCGQDHIYYPYNVYTYPYYSPNVLATNPYYYYYYYPSAY